MGWSLLVVIVGLLLAGVILHEARPTPIAGREADADALARSMIAAVNGDAWDATGAVAFKFHDHRYLWDRTRGLVQVRWGDMRVLLNTADRSGVAFEGGSPVDAADPLDHAWRRFCNDTFWLNPVTKMFDEGTRRELVSAVDGQAVLVTYASGGVTPGDSYLWVPGESGRPARWQMWVSIIPIGGIPSDWSGWEQLSTGAWISTRHQIVGSVALRIEEARGTHSLVEILDGAEDPFVAVGMAVAETNP